MSDVFAAFSRFAKTFPKGSVIFSEFEPGDCFYLIQTGRVQLIKIVNGFEKNLDILQPSEIFGEMAILENSPRSATAIAYDNVKALEFNKANFEVLMMGNPAIAMKLLKTFVKRIYAQKRRFMILTIPDRMARVGDVFLMLDETLPNLDRAADFRTFPTTFDEVARWAGLPVCEVEDELHRFMDQGKMEVFEDHITVKNISELTRYVNARRSMGKED
jgi:CRP/FNR family transcriptional regulator, cyclic AMP receptor protein